MAKTDTAPAVDTWRAGEIRKAFLTLRLADASKIEHRIAVLVLDVRGDTDTTIRVLWQQYDLTAGPGYSHLIGEPRWQVINAGTGQAVGRGEPVRLHLQDLVGTYEPRDPAYNSLEILRDSAIARVEQLKPWRAEHRPPEVAEAVAEARAAKAQAEAAREHRDDRIRAALDAGVNVYDLETTTGFSRSRIYQIRDRRR